ncbi:uncharacterized protein isoform X2 [Leptinotarsa decemlineata]|uniref:uncharacterized protein isoform X2 n=1 Tax=Leptinotarsa decemlineata TaxID=7539 RepID=UPI003D3049BA
MVPATGEYVISIKKKEIEAIDENVTLESEEKYDALDVGISENEFQTELIKSEDDIDVVYHDVKFENNMQEVNGESYCGLCGGRLIITMNFLSLDLQASCYCQSNEFNAIHGEDMSQDLKPSLHSTSDMVQRERCSEWALEKLAENPLFYRQILFSDEAHFWLNGYVNKQNCRIWSEEQPEAVQELPMHPEKCTVWCGLYTGGIIGPYFFKDAVGRNVTVNGDCYRSMLTNFLLPKMEELNLVDMWFQQDGATCHTARDSMAILRENFGEQFISRNGPVSWPPRSCDLTPLDYFLWGYVKSKVYSNKPATIPALEDNISEEIRAIPAEMLEKVAQNWTFRMDHLRRSRGQHFNEIIFKK